MLKGKDWEASVAHGYTDRWLTVDEHGVAIRAYYFPWGSKRIPLDAIESLERVDMTLSRGRGRIWGTANPRVWASLDPGRRKKKFGFVLDLGTFVKPFITPDDPDAFEESVRSRIDLPPATQSSRRAPLV
jgi:hypothetical protein